jgi:hypothetical protein
VKALSDKAEKELVDFSRSDSLRRDMEIVTSNRYNPFVRNGIADADAYVEFVMEYNEFINHRPKPFVPMAEKVMKL